MDQIPSKNSRSLSREEWLELAVSCLKKGGATRFRLDDLIRAMPVTKGSFYHHFSGKHDFQRALVEFWDRHYTEIIVRILESLPEDTPPEDRLLALARSVWQLDYGKLELAVKSMAQDDADLTELVKQVEATRYEQVGRLFEAMGFSGEEKHVRTHAFVVLTSSEDIFERPELDGDPEEHLRARLKFFTRP